MKNIWNAYPLEWLDEMRVPRINFAGGVLYYDHDPFKIEDYIIYMQNDSSYSWESVWKDEGIKYTRVAQVKKDGTLELL